MLFRLGALKTERKSIRAARGYAAEITGRRAFQRSRSDLWGYAYFQLKYVFNLLKSDRQKAYVNTASTHFRLLADLLFEEAYLSSTPRL